MSEPDAVSPHQLASEAAAVLAERTGVSHHDLALTLGSGWARAASAIGEITAEIPASEIPGFRSSAVAGHPGTLTSVRLADGRRALILGARAHLYEGRGVRDVVHGVRTAAAAGAQFMILTNGAGGLDPDHVPGDPMLISDHLNLTAQSPVEGAEFVDLTDLYSARLRDIARQCAPDIREGVYAQVPGPHYETPAEIRYLRTIGAQAVGMSTALEAIAARQVGLEVLGISLITNLAAGIQESPLSHDEVIAAGRAAEPRLARLLADIVAAIPEL